MTFGSCTVRSSGLSDSDCQAWQTFYSSTGGSSWTHCSDSQFDPCSCSYTNRYGLLGVTCNSNSNGISSRINKIQLTYNKLSGIIPKEIGNLGSLTALGLHSNKLSGSIPKEIGNLGSLKHLELFNNELIGSIPTEIGNLGSLSFLSLNNNELSGRLPTEIGNLGSLTDLELFGNGLSGSIPKEIGNLTNLTGLVLSDNGLSGNIPTEIGKLTNLKNLQLDNNKLSGIIPTDIGNLTTLTVSCNLYNTDLCFPPDFNNSSVCKTPTSGIPTCPSLYSCINNQCTITTDTGGTYYQNSCNIYCTKQSPPTPSPPFENPLYSCGSNGSCTLSTDGNGTYYSSSCEVYCHS